MATANMKGLSINNDVHMKPATTIRRGVLQLWERELVDSPEVKRKATVAQLCAPLAASPAFVGITDGMLQISLIITFKPSGILPLAKKGALALMRTRELGTSCPRHPNIAKNSNRTAVERGSSSDVDERNLESISSISSLRLAKVDMVRYIWRESR